MGLYTGSKSDFGHDYNCTFTPGSGPLPTTTTTRPAPQPGPAPVPACLRDQASIPKPTSASAEGVPITEFTSYTDSSGKQWAYFQADMSQSAHDQQLGQTQFITSCDPSNTQGWTQATVLASDTSNGVVPRKTIGCGDPNVLQAVLDKFGVTCP